jgi:predicted naringenin-chalcone synthase
LWRGHSLPAGGASVLAAQPAAVVACVAVEVCSAAFYLDDDPGVLMSACLFGDGAAATIWRGVPGPRGLRCDSFSTLHQPENRDRIRFEMRQGKLRNLLHASVPGLAAAAVAELLAGERRRPGSRPITRMIAHVGGRDVLDAIEKSCPGLRPHRQPTGIARVRQHEQPLGAVRPGTGLARRVAR